MSHPKAKIGLLALLVAHILPSAAAAAELLPDPAFTRSTRQGDWWATPNITMDYGPGALCGMVAAGSEKPWDAILGINGLTLAKGESYRLSLIASGEPGGSMRALVQEARPPWVAQGEVVRRLAGDKTVVDTDFTAGEDVADAQLVFQLGGSDTAWRFCLHAASVISGQPAPAAASSVQPSRIRVNQTAYVPDGPKRATLVKTGGMVDWTLVSAAGEAVASGKTTAHGHDPASGLDVQLIDFSGVRATGDGFRLVADGETSPPFAIATGLYDRLRADALSYFYKVRSGIEIREDLAGKGYGRPAGHAGRPPNRGDSSVTCLDAPTARKIYVEPWSCDYRLDVAGGWYDAGDFGKYVVNGGIATAQLLSVYERALSFSGGASPALSDRFFPIPEAGNGIPDILDEARWELDFLMAMTVPEGETYAGMAHHKLHGKGWPPVPLMPDRDSEERVLHRPSTAATLNLAAIAAWARALCEPGRPV
ncbi:glycoside hydrolase family 9 protein, partial [Hoeflea olei]|uniref:glycoside hydrolase family 9 protein n=1 Tax=Hoeflea olei TaxID=1480615 RepID=UPI001FD97A32